MKRTWPLIGVADVARSFAWYQTLLGLPPSAPGNGLPLFFRVDDFDAAVPRARALAAPGTLDDEPHHNTSTGSIEFSLRDPDGYHVHVNAWAPGERAP